MDIPSELVSHILSFITESRNILMCMLTCKQWYSHIVYLLEKFCVEFPLLEHRGYFKYMFDDRDAIDITRHVPRLKSSTDSDGLIAQAKEIAIARASEYISSLVGTQCISISWTIFHLRIKFKQVEFQYNAYGVDKEPIKIWIKKCGEWYKTMLYWGSPKVCKALGIKIMSYNQLNEIVHKIGKYILEK